MNTYEAFRLLALGALRGAEGDDQRAAALEAVRSLGPIVGAEMEAMLASEALVGLRMADDRQLKLASVLEEALT